MSPVAQMHHRFTVSSPPALLDAQRQPLCGGTLRQPATPVDEQVAFRFDFAAFYLSYSSRDRDLIEGLMTGDETMDRPTSSASRRRISQKRREYMAGWRRFIGEA